MTNRCPGYSILTDLFVGGCDSVARLCARLRQDDRASLCKAASAWYNTAFEESATWSLSIVQQRLLRNAWLEHPGSSIELCRRAGGDLQGVVVIMAARRWLVQAEQHLMTVFACRVAMAPAAATLRPIALDWRTIRRIRSEG